MVINNIHITIDNHWLIIMLRMVNTWSINGHWWYGDFQSHDSHGAPPCPLLQEISIGGSYTIGIYWVIFMGHSLAFVFAVPSTTVDASNCTKNVPQIHPVVMTITLGIFFFHLGSLGDSSLQKYHRGLSRPWVVVKKDELPRTGTL